MKIPAEILLRGMPLISGQLILAGQSYWAPPPPPPSNTPTPSPLPHSPVFAFTIFLCTHCNRHCDNILPFIRLAVWDIQGEEEEVVEKVDEVDKISSSSSIGGRQSEEPVNRRLDVDMCVLHLINCPLADHKNLFLCWNALSFRSKAMRWLVAETDWLLGWEP